MRKYISSFLFAPVFMTLACSLFINIIYVFLPNTIPQISEEGQLIDILTYISYGFMFIAFAAFYGDFKDNKFNYWIYIFLGLCALLREMGIQHYLASTDTTAFKIKFFTNTQNPMSEKILALIILLIVFGVLIYLAKKYAVYLIKSFLKLDPISWSIYTLIGFLLASKIVDRFPSNFRKYTGEFLNENLKDNLSILEESLEIFFPLIVIVILIQYHLKLEDRKLN